MHKTLMKINSKPICVNKNENINYSQLFELILLIPPHIPSLIDSDMLNCSNSL